MPVHGERSSVLVLTEKERKTVQKVSRQLSNSKSSYVNPGRLYVEIETSREEKEILLKVIKAFKVREETASTNVEDQNDNSRSGSDIVYSDEQDGPLGRFAKGIVSSTCIESRESLLEQQSYRKSLDSSYLNPGRLYVTEEDMQIITTISRCDRFEQTKPSGVEESGKGNVVQREKTQNSAQRLLYSDDGYAEENKGLRPEEIEFKSDANSVCEFQEIRVAKFEPLSSIPQRGHDNFSFEGENDTISNPRLPKNTRVRYNGSEETVHIDLVKPVSKATHVKQERDGKIIDLTSGPAKQNTSSSARALERFRKAAEKVKAAAKEIRPEKIPEEDFAIWKDRGTCGWFGLLATLGGILAFFVDIALDLKVAADHLSNQDYWWCGLTTSLVVIPSVLVNLVSLFWYLEDEEVAGQEPETGWKKIYLIHFCQLGLAERSWRLMKKGYRIIKKKDTKLYDYKLFISRNLDLAMLQMFLAFTEDAPQLVLQLYVLLRRRLLKTESLSEIWTIISICFSFFSYSRALVNYIMCLRDSKRHKGRLRWYGYLSMWLWRAFMIISRMLVLVFFSSAFRGWFFLVFVIHYGLVFLLLGRHEVSFFPGHTCKQYFFRAIVAYIHIFCFFSLEGVRTIPWACKYYLMTFAENMTLTLLWYFNSTKHLNYELELAGLIVVFLFYFVGLAIMCCYYRYLHPRFKHPKLDKLMSWTSTGSEESAAIDEERKKSEEIEEEPQIVQQWELWI